jgi:two-component system sensor histidine kinase KdpD
MGEQERPPLPRGFAAAIGGVALATAIVYPLSQLTPPPALSVVYILAVLGVAWYWGFGLGMFTAVLSAAAFDFFCLPPVGSFTIAQHREWIALAAFLLLGGAVALVASLARTRAFDAEQRRREADLTAVMAQELLGAARLEDALPATAHRLAAAVGAASASIELGVRDGGFPLRDGDRQIGTLVLPTPARERVETRIVPALQSILAAALHRAELQAEVVETAALRRSDETKTAVLRSVSHDLRTPVTAILAAAEALPPGEARSLVLESATRLARLIEKLLDLSLLEAGSTQPRAEWCSLDDVIAEAVDHAGARDAVRVALDERVPLLLGDPVQLERAFANLIENAVRHSDDAPVSVLARVAGDRVRVRVVDQGPGIPLSEQERIFMPFYRSPGAAPGHGGSGLGLAIAKGFIEAGGGRISVESLPGQGTSFIVEFPLPDRAVAPA